MSTPPSRALVAALGRAAAAVADANVLACVEAAACARLRHQLAAALADEAKAKAEAAALKAELEALKTKQAEQTVTSVAAAVASPPPTLAVQPKSTRGRGWAPPPLRSSPPKVGITRSSGRV